MFSSEKARTPSGFCFYPANGPEKHEAGVQRGAEAEARAATEATNWQGHRQSDVDPRTFANFAANTGDCGYLLYLLYKRHIMKIFLIFCMALVVASAALSAQLTLTANNYSTLQPGDVLSWSYLNGNQIGVPARGDNRIWDYSTLAVTNHYTQTAESSSNAAFPTADVRIPTIYSFAGYNLGLDQYFDFTTEGYYSLGDSYAAATLPGDTAGDTLFLQAQDIALQRTELLFPATYASSWSSSAVRYVINAEVKIGIFPKAPAQLVQNFAITTDTIIGWGELRLPDSKRLDVLLKKQTTVRIDSFYIAGIAAPASVLNQLGLKQGEVTREERYIFYGENLKGEAMTINFLTRGTTSFTTAYFNGSIPTSVQENTPAAASRLYPNPVHHGQAMLSFQKTTSQPWNVVLCDMLGREVFRRTVEAPQGEIQLPVQFGSTPASGLYIYSIYSDTGIRTATGTVHVR